MIAVLCNNYTVFMPTISDHESVLLAALQHTQNLHNCYLDRCHHLQLSQGTSSGSISDSDTEDNTNANGDNASSSSSSSSTSNTGSLSLPSSSPIAPHPLLSITHTFAQCFMPDNSYIFYLVLVCYFHVQFPRD